MVRSLPRKIITPEPVVHYPEIDEEQYELEAKRLREKMEFKRLTKALRVGILRRNIGFLHDALAIVKSSDFANRLATLIREAEQVVEEVQKLQRFAHKIMEMSQKTVSELHRYKNPSSAMVDIMKATFLLLGEPSESLKTWEEITALMRQGGKESLLHRIRSLKTANVNIEAAKEAAGILRKYSEDRAKTTSAGVRTFYLWCINVLCHFGLMEPATPIRIKKIQKLDQESLDKSKDDLSKRPRWINYY